MKSLRVATVFFMAAMTSPGLQSDTRGDLQAELLEMGRMDQEVRGRFMALISQGGPEVFSSDEFSVLAEEMNGIDQANIARLDEIVEQVGWPGEKIVGEDAAGAARLILSHAPLEKQKKYLPLLRQAVSDGQAAASDLAMIEDDIALADDGAQIYGTKVSVENGRAVLSPVVEPERLDERRAAVGLPPIDEYLELAESELGMPVDRSALIRD